MTQALTDIIELEDMLEHKLEGQVTELYSGYYRDMARLLMDTYFTIHNMEPVTDLTEGIYTPKELCDMIWQYATRTDLFN